MEDAFSYWKQKLHDASLRVDLTTDHPRSSVKGSRHATHPVTFSHRLSGEIRDLSRSEGVSPSHLLLTAYVALLYRHTGREEIVVGLPVIKEERASGTDPIDVLLNSLILRVAISGQLAFRELLIEVHQVIEKLCRSQELPYEGLMEKLEREFSSRDVHLPQLVFAYQAGSGGHPASTGLSVARSGAAQPADYADMTFSLHDDLETIHGVVEYNAGLFEASTIATLLGHYENILSAAVAEPDCPVATLPLLTPAERQQILVEFNDSNKPYHDQVTIARLFELQVEKTPDAVAIICEGEQLTYQQLNRQANQLAHFLQKLGVGPEVCAGICLDRSIDMVISILGILKAGGAYVPLDPEYPEERLAFMLADTKAPVLITRRGLMEGNLRQQTQVVYLDENRPDIAAMAGTNPLTAANALTLAYVIYTSGSTGQPKGVCCVHRSVINLLTDFENRQPITGGGVCSWWTSIGFDVSVYEIFSAILYGRALWIVPQNVRVDSRRFFECLQTYRVKGAYVTPSQLNDLADWLEAAGDLELERLLVGVEPIKEPLLARIALAIPTVKIINGYGPTEATVCSTLFDFDPLDVQDRNTPIGRAVQNTQIYLLDGHGQPVPVGVPGELHIAGDGLARGYLNRPELTAQKFIHNPFSPDSNGLMYRTGDLARYLPDGNIVFLGRFDEQVKIRGYRIELGEIETGLRQHPAVRDVLLLAHEYSLGDKRLIAYLILGDGERPASREWRDFLKKKLPGYMIPSAFVIMDNFPLTPNGKVDRKALPIPEYDRSDFDGQYAEPRTAIEHTIADLWAGILNVKNIGIHDNFFDLGGDSILSIQITAKMNEAGLYLPPHQVFDHPTIAQLADIVQASPAMQAEQGLVMGELPLTPVQQWFFEQNFAEPHHWNQGFLLRVQQSIEPDLLAKALQQLLNHHDALRLRFTRGENRWRQAMGPAAEAGAFSQVDLSTTKEEDQFATIQSTTAKLQASLDLSKGPLVRAVLFDLGPQKQGYFFMVINHLVVDGVSWRILLEQLDLLYQQLRRHKAPQLPPKTTSYKQWAEKLVEYAQSGVLAQEFPYWLDRKDKPFAHLPVDHAGSESRNTEASARMVTASLSVQETERLIRDVPKAYQTHINDVLLTALMQVFSAWTGISTLLINLEGHGREGIFKDVDLSRTVGWFTTIFPVFLSVEGVSDPVEMLKSVKEQLRHIPNRGIGHGLLRYLCQDQEMASQLNSLPEAEVSFNYLGQFDQIPSASSLFKLTNEYCGPERSLKAHRHHLLDITGMIIDGQLQLEWRYSENVHRQATIEKLAQGLVDALKILIDRCQSPHAGGYTPSDFPEANLSQQELDDLLKEIHALESED